VIGSLPMSELAPLDYRVALDVAMVALSGRDVLLRCAVPQLANEVGQRLAYMAERDATAGLWVEPLADSWEAELEALRQLPADAPLIVVHATPLSRLRPERTYWHVNPLGVWSGGGGRLRKALRRAGFRIERRAAVQSGASVALARLAGLAARARRPDVADRTAAAARSRSCATSRPLGQGTLELIFARKEAGR
jgi:hypothetical protein